MEKNLTILSSDFLNNLEDDPIFQGSDIIASEEWFILRFYFYYKNLTKDSKKVTLKQKSKSLPRSFFAFLIFPLRIIFRERNKRLILINNAEVLNLGGKQQQRIFFDTSLAQDSILFEKFTNWQRPISISSSISFLPIQVLEIIIHRFFKPTLSQKNNIIIINSYLRRLRGDFLINSFNPSATIMRYNFYVAFWNLFLIWMKPKEILITDYYNVANLALVKTSKKFGIKIIELQHGVISSGHRAYFFAPKLCRNITPDELLHYFPVVFNQPEYFYIDKKKLKRINHPLLRWFRFSDVILEDYKNQLRSNYKKIILITLQDTSEKKVSELILEVAHELKDYFFILLPRTIYSSTTVLPKNAEVNWRNNFYELMQISDIHITHYSTCALEAGIFGVKSICIDVDGLASKVFKELVADSNNSISFIQKKEDLIRQLL